MGLEHSGYEAQCCQDPVSLAVLGQQGQLLQAAISCWRHIECASKEKHFHHPSLSDAKALMPRMEPHTWPDTASMPSPEPRRIIELFLYCIIIQAIMGYYGIHILEMLIRLLFPFVFVDMSVHLSVSLHLFTLYSLATCLSKKNCNQKDNIAWNLPAWLLPILLIAALGKRCWGKSRRRNWTMGIKSFSCSFQKSFAASLWHPKCHFHTSTW